MIYSKSKQTHHAFIFNSHIPRSFSYNAVVFYNKFEIFCENRKHLIHSTTKKVALTLKDKFELTSDALFQLHNVSAS